MSDQALFLHIVDLGLINFLIPNNKYNLQLFLFTNKGPNTIWFWSHWFYQSFNIRCSLCKFCFCHACHINLTASAFTDKGSYSYNSGKGPLHSQAVLLYGASECSLSMHPYALILRPFPMKGASLCYLTWYSMSGIWCKYHTACLKSTQGIRHVHTPGKQRFRTQWSLPLCIFTCELSHNPILQPKTVSCKAWCSKNPGQSWQTQYTFILTTCFSSVMHIFFYYFARYHYFPL